MPRIYMYDIEEQTPANLGEGALTACYVRGTEQEAEEVGEHDEDCDCRGCSRTRRNAQRRTRQHAHRA